MKSTSLLSTPFACTVLALAMGLGATSAAAQGFEGRGRGDAPPAVQERGQRGGPQAGGGERSGRWDGDRSGRDHGRGDGDRSGRDHGRWEGDRHQGGRHWDGDRHREARQYHGPQYHVRPAPVYGWRSAPYYVPPVAYGYHAPRYVVGDRLPWEYRRHLRVVNDWNAYQLYAPPAGYHWVQSDAGNYLLVAIASGLIAQLLLSH